MSGVFIRYYVPILVFLRFGFLPLFAQNLLDITTSQICEIQKMGVADTTLPIQYRADTKPISRMELQNMVLDHSNDMLESRRSATTTSLSLEDITTTALGSTGLGSHSSVFADVTGDGRPDLYITMYYYVYPSDISDLFYLNTNGSVFNEEASAWGINDADDGSHGACFADLDNDGDYDLINGTTIRWPDDVGEHNDIYRNNIESSDSSFTDVTPACVLGRTEKTRAVVAFDMDGDDDLDVFTVTGSRGSSNPDQRNEIYRNEGSMSFTSITTGALYEAPVCQGATDTDYDGDGDIDIITANRTGNVNILRNGGSGNFTQISPSSIGINHGAGDGITMGDVDNDGDLDMVLVSEGPPSVAYLYMNDGDGTFTYANQSWQDINGYMGGFADLDNDGDLDLVFAGHDRCFLNDGNGNFSNGPTITYNKPPDPPIVDPRSVAFADIDNDGDMDFAIGDKKSKGRLIRNDLTSGGNWLKVKLVSPQGQAGAFGAKTRVYPGRQAGVTLLGLRESRSSNGYLGQDDPVLHFGLGSNTTADVVVTFLDGSTATRVNVAAEQTLTIDRADVLAQVKIFLEGPYDTEGDTMTTVLNSGGHIPTISPYSEDPRTVSSIPANITDWVLVQLRSTVDGSAVASKSGFLHNDGRIVGDDGTTGKITLDAAAGNYYIVVRYRNHVAVMSEGTHTLNSGSSTLYDFTAGDGGQFYGTGGAKELESGVWGMWSGDINQDGEVTTADYTSWYNSARAGDSGYHDTDCNCDCEVTTADYTVWYNNARAGASSEVP